MLTEKELARYLAIKQQIADLEKELKPIKQAIETKGSFETKDFRVFVTEIEQNRTVDCNTLLERLGPVKVTELELIKTSTYNKIKVERKEYTAA